MHLSKFCTQNQIQLIKKLELYDKAEQILQEFVDNQINNIDCHNLILKLINTKKLELVNTRFRKLIKSETLNPHKMTMIDPIELQKNLATMVKNNCEVIVLEVSSQGLDQNRHWGLGKFDFGVFLNLYPEHIEAHGGFEQYKLAKAKLFKNLKRDSTVVVNGNDKHSDEMLGFCPDTAKKIKVTNGVDFNISEFSETMYKSFSFKGKNIDSKFNADFEVENAIIAATICNEYLQQKHQKPFDNLLLQENYFQIPGRMEWVVVNNEIV